MACERGERTLARGRWLGAIASGVKLHRHWSVISHFKFGSEVWFSRPGHQTDVLRPEQGHFGAVRGSNGPNKHAQSIQTAQTKGLIEHHGAYQRDDFWRGSWSYWIEGCS